MRYLLIILLSFGFLFSRSQEKKQAFPVITLRTNPLSFAEQDAGVMLGLGIQWNPKWSVSVDPMYIFYSPYGGDIIDDGHNGEHIKVRGFKIRTDLRYYIHGYEYGKRGWFVGAELHYKKVSGTHWDDFGMNCVNGQCDFYQRATYDQVKTEIGIAAKIGMVRRLWSPRWSFEFYCGAGLKMKSFTERNQPAGGSFLQSPDQGFLGSDDNVLPMLPGSIKFVYRIF